MYGVMSLSLMLVMCDLVFVSAVSRGPERSSPRWYKPCGESHDDEITFLTNNSEDSRAILDRIKLQHQTTLTDYLSHDYEFLYEKVMVKLPEHQYIPNWVPGKRDVDMVRQLARSEIRSIIRRLPKLHLDLQKFAVAFEELIEDEENSKVLEALKTTQSYLIMMLCEVESNIVSLPFVEVPTKVDRSVMSLNERHPVDETRRLIRDWGVMLKYKNYLHAWRHVFNY